MRILTTLPIVGCIALFVLCAILEYRVNEMDRRVFTLERAAQHHEVVKINWKPWTAALVECRQRTDDLRFALDVLIQTWPVKAPGKRFHLPGVTADWPPWPIPGEDYGDIEDLPNWRNYDGGNSL